MSAAWALLVDGSTIEADANRDKRDGPDKITDAWDHSERITRPVQAYLDDLDAAGPPQPNSSGKKPKGPKYISETDPQAAWSLKDGPGRFSYETNYLVDDLNGVIVDMEATPARLSQEIVVTKKMLERSKEYGFTPISRAADKSYGTSPLLAWLEDREIIQYIPVLDRTKQTDGKLTREAFKRDIERDVFICPQGHELKLRADSPERRLKRYQGNAKICGACPIKANCTDAPSRNLSVSTDEPLREQLRVLAGTASYKRARRKRKKVEMLFAHLKRHLGLKRPGSGACQEQKKNSSSPQPPRTSNASPNWHPPEDRTESSRMIAALTERNGKTGANTRCCLVSFSTISVLCETEFKKFTVHDAVVLRGEKDSN